MPYMLDLQKRLGFFPRIEELKHGNKRKLDRIVWALQGRFEHGQCLSIKLLIELFFGACI